MISHRLAAVAGAAAAAAGGIVFTGGVASAAFPAPYNAFIVFSSTRANLGGSTPAGNLWLVNPSGVAAGGATVSNDPSQTHELTATSADDQGGAFSPDGSKVVFFSNRGTGNEQIWEVPSSNVPAVQDTTGTTSAGVVAPDGSVKVLSDTSQDTWPSWSPDGHTIAFVRGSNQTTGREIDVLDTSVPAAAPVKVVSGDLIALARPVFDPADPTKLVYTSAASGHLVLVSNLGTPSQTSTDLSANTGIGPDAADEAPDFSPDGSTLLFDSNRPVSGAAGANQLFTLSLAAATAASPASPAAASPVFVDANGAGTFSGGSDTQPTFSPTGTQIAFTRAVQGQDVNSYMLKPSAHDTANPSSGIDLTLAPTNPADSQPDWQGSTTPPAALPEAAWAAALPILGVAVAGGVVIRRRRRSPNPG